MVAGNSAAANADSLIYDVMAAFYTACASFMGQNYGARNRERVKKSYFISLAYSFAIGLILGFLLVLFGRQFLHLFSPAADVIEAGMFRLTIMGFSYGFSAFMDCTIAASGPWQEPHSHGGGDSGLLRAADHLGLHRLRLVRHHHIAVPGLHLLLDHHRSGGNRLFPPRLQAAGRQHGRLSCVKNPGHAMCPGFL